MSVHRDTQFYVILNEVAISPVIFSSCALLNLNLFGEGRRLDVACSAASFLRAAAQQGVELIVFLHSPRDLTERKEAARRNPRM